MRRHRLAALASLILLASALALAVVTAIASFPRGLVVAACVVLAVAAGWYGVLRRGPVRAAGAIAAVALTVAAVWILLTREPLLTILVVATAWLGLGAARAAFTMRVQLPAVPPPRRGVLFYNPRSGGGKALRFNLRDEARARGIQPIELSPGGDLERLVRDAVAAGADGLAMAGGDGSQGVVAAVAAELGLPYACIPAGTRNHFALDLGVDRDDVVGALDAFVDGGERVVDLADVNGRVFVNNVSLGLYAEAVQRPGYREAKLRSLLDTVPDTLGPDADAGLALRWTEPDGHEHRRGAAILVSNNPYRLGRAIGSGTRPRLDAGLLGVTVIGAAERESGRPPPRAWREWSAAGFEVRSDRPVAAGVDGEATRLEPEIRFRIHPATLRVRIARRHPGSSPSAMQPDGAWAGVRALAGLAAGRDRRSLPTAPRDAVRLVLAPRSPDDAQPLGWATRTAP